MLGMPSLMARMGPYQEVTFKEENISLGYSKGGDCAGRVGGLSLHTHTLG